MSQTANPVRRSHGGRRPCVRKVESGPTGKPEPRGHGPRRRPTTQTTLPRTPPSTPLSCTSAGTRTPRRLYGAGARSFATTPHQSCPEHLSDGLATPMHGGSRHGLGVLTAGRQPRSRTPRGRSSQSVDELDQCQPSESPRWRTASLQGPRPVDRPRRTDTGHRRDEQHLRGKVTLARARLTRATPSSGWRRPSITGAMNSANSSRKSTPCVARLRRCALRARMRGACPCQAGISRIATLCVSCCSRHWSLRQCPPGGERDQLERTRGLS